MPGGGRPFLSLLLRSSSRRSQASPLAEALAEPKKNARTERGGAVVLIQRGTHLHQVHVADVFRSAREIGDLFEFGCFEPPGIACGRSGHFVAAHSVDVDGEGYARFPSAMRRASRKTSRGR